jgi:hypothetical protein
LTFGAPITLRTARSADHKGQVHTGGISFAKYNWVTDNGALNDSFPVPAVVSKLEEITNNIGWHINSPAGGVWLKGPNTGIRLLWAHIYNCGKPGKPNENAISVGDTQIQSEIAYCWMQDNVYGDTVNYVKNSKPDWGQFSIMFRSIFLEGLGRPAAGVRLILKHLVRKFRALGGELKLRSGVKRMRSGSLETAQRQNWSPCHTRQGTPLPAQRRGV